MHHQVANHCIKHEYAFIGRVYEEAKNEKNHCKLLRQHIISSISLVENYITKKWKYE